MQNRQKKSSHKKPKKIYSFDEANDRLYDLFRNHDFDFISHEVRQKLVQFYQILMTTQISENFTRLVRFNDIAIKHFIDSLIIDQLTPLHFPLMDVGTGAGFPGIPLQILRPDQEIYLVEGVKKRVDYLKKVRSQLELSNLKVIGRYMNLDFTYPTKGIVTRALTDIGYTLYLCSQSLQSGGYIYFMKGPGCGPEVKKARELFKGDYKHLETLEYKLPKTTHERSLVIFEKLQPIGPEKYHQNFLGARS
ncbi:MAG: 16S rRNA (guanine(527)-N(7))-methyltransferase RsmG [Bdellovibrionales bacterium]|nr:16S rRNA (guanine(527)-N(7))-methyltransferase RsmG [Bdellovibrionales bacterium]